ncbi:MAG TPA: cysteine dioxygenase family protein [Candidatus Dormibacteraeota bacterium]
MDALTVSPRDAPAAHRARARGRQPAPGTAAWLAAAIAAACRGETSAIESARATQSLLRTALRERGWLPEDMLAGDPSRYRSRTLHVDRAAGVSIRVLAWRHGQQTPIHDHVAWCVIGVYEGIEHERRYSISPDGGGEQLVHSEDRVMRAGDTAVLLPPDDIHEVRCASDHAVSIHVYGAALDPETPSMRRAYGAAQKAKSYVVR